MAVSQDLADRVRAVLAPRAPFEERTMFGGLAFLVDGRMAVAISGDALMVRVGTGGRTAALERGARPMTMGTRTMAGWVVVDGPRLADTRELDAWGGDRSPGRPHRASEAAEVEPSSRPCLYLALPGLNLGRVRGRSGRPGP